MAVDCIWIELVEKEEAELLFEGDELEGDEGEEEEADVVGKL